MSMRIDDIFELVKEHPCSTTTDLMYLIYADIESRPYNERVTARNIISKRLWRLHKQGYVEPVPDTKPTAWKPFGSDTIACKCNFKASRGKSLRARCREYGMAESTVRGRIKRGWSVEDALSIPVIKVIK